MYMKHQEIDLIEKQQVREKFMERIEVLNKVKELILLDELEMATTEMVAEYYGEDVGTIKMCVKRHSDEIESDGYKVWKKKDFNESNIVLLSSTKTNFTVLLGNEETTISNRGIALFPKRAILRVGMLLRDSEVAKEVRTQLLNIVEVVEKENKELLTTHVDYELEMSQKIGLAIVKGNYDLYLKLMAELNDYKSRHIEKLEKEVKDKEQTIEKQRETIKETTTIAQATADLMGCKNKFTVEQVSKAFAVKGIGRNNTYKWLRSEKIFTKSNTPFACYVERKYFKNIFYEYTDRFGEKQKGVKPMITGKGVVWLYKKFHERGFIIEKTLEQIETELGV